MALEDLWTALDLQASVQKQVDRALEDLRNAKQKGDEEKVEKAEEKVEKAEAKVEKAEAKVEKAKKEVKEAKKEVKEAEEKVEEAEAKVEKAKKEVDEKATQEKAIRCTASVLSQFSRKMQKIHESYFTYLHILWFKQFCFFSEYPEYASKR